MPRKANTVTYQALMGQVEKLKQQAVRLRQQEVKTVVSEIQEQMKRYNLSTNDLQLGSTIKVEAPVAQGPKKRQTRRKATPKYQDPVSGVTWSGRGKTPKWITSAQGKQKQDFAIAN
jgi:DNA-binding protein H-NS